MSTQLHLRTIFVDRAAFSFNHLPRYIITSLTKYMSSASNSKIMASTIVSFGFLTWYTKAEETSVGIFVNVFNVITQNLRMQFIWKLSLF